MFEKISDGEFKNLTRSTVPLLSWWKNQAFALSVLENGCRLSDLASASVTFEFPTPSFSPHDKASYTDVMVESPSTAIAIEGKWTEPRYKTVSEWSREGNVENRKSVLTHWLNLIRNSATRVDVAALQIIPYQMLHRTASACSRSDKLPVVLYQVFRDQKHVNDYLADLRHLSSALGPTAVQLWLLEIQLTVTKEYLRIASLAEAAAPESRSALIRRAICETELFNFGEPSFTRIS